MNTLMLINAVTTTTPAIKGDVQVLDADGNSVDISTTTTYNRTPNCEFTIMCNNGNDGMKTFAFDPKTLTVSSRTTNPAAAGSNILTFPTGSTIVNDETFIGYVLFKIEDKTNGYKGDGVLTEIGSLELKSSSTDWSTIQAAVLALFTTDVKTKYNITTVTSSSNKITIVDTVGNMYIELVGSLNDVHCLKTGTDVVPNSGESLARLERDFATHEGYNPTFDPNAEIQTFDEGNFMIDKSKNYRSTVITGLPVNNKQLGTDRGFERTCYIVADNSNNTAVTAHNTLTAWLLSVANNA